MKNCACTIRIIEDEEIYCKLDLKILLTNYPLRFVNKKENSNKTLLKDGLSSEKQTFFKNFRLFSLIKDLNYTENSTFFKAVGIEFHIKVP